MPKRHSKKLNPRKIPLAKREINETEIIEEATKDDLYHGWLLVLTALAEQVPLEEIPEIVEGVNQFIAKPAVSRKWKAEDEQRAGKMMGLKPPYEHLRLNEVKSAVELEHFKKKLSRFAIFNAFCIICLGIDSLTKLSPEKIRQIFFSADLTLAEIESGYTSYEDLEERLDHTGISIHRITDDMHHVVILNQTTYSPT